MENGNCSDSESESDCEMAEEEKSDGTIKKKTGFFGALGSMFKSSAIKEASQMPQPQQRNFASTTVNMPQSSMMQQN